MVLIALAVLAGYVLARQVPSRRENARLFREYGATPHWPRVIVCAVLPVVALLAVALLAVALHLL